MSDEGLSTLLVGLDGACLPVLRPLLDAGRLPTLADLFDRGAVGPLESQLPPWTPSAWPSLYTGVNPGKHGVYSFLRYEGYDWDVVDATDVRARSLWELLDVVGRRSVVVNVPVTDPPAAFDGALLSGFVGPDDPGCHPPGLLDDVREELGEYRVYSHHEFADDAPRDARVEEYRRLVAMRGEAFRYLADRFAPDFGFLQFQQTDTVVHDLPGDEAALATVYEAIDDQLSRVLDACDPETVVVASDHGLGTFDSEFRVNEHLRRAGLLETTTSADGRPSWVPIWRRRLAGEDDAGVSGTEADADDGSVSAAAVDRTLAGLAAVGLSPARVATLLDRVGLLDAARRHLPRSVRERSGVGEHVDFTASTAYLRLPVELGVRLNLAGREPDGVVAPEAYESVRARVMEHLRAAETPAGDPVFEAVLPREAVFHGPHLEAAPDVVTVPREFEQFPAARVGGDLFAPPGEPWNHKLDGVVSVTGPGVDAGELVDAHLLQVAPTVLATLDVPRSERMDADALPVADPAGERRYPPPADPTGGLDPEPGSDDDPGGADPDATVDRLSDLGYL